MLAASGLPYVVPYVPVRKTSVYLPDHLKRALALTAGVSGRSEAEVLRAAVEAAVGPGAGATPGGASPALDAPVPGRLVGVGVGPGDPDLVTVRAVVALRSLAKADSLQAIPGPLSNDERS